jgi:hypothetical protein
MPNTKAARRCIPPGGYRVVPDSRGDYAAGVATASFSPIGAAR